MAITDTTISLSERAAKARAAANDLEAQAIALQREDDSAQRALVERQRLPVQAAVAAAARAALAEVDRPKVELRPWVDVLADPNCGLDALFSAWCQHRASHAARAATVRVGGAYLDNNDPRYLDGNLLPWRRDVEDRMALSLFLPEIEHAISIRTAAAAGAASAAIAQKCTDAGNAAAARIK